MNYFTVAEIAEKLGYTEKTLKHYLATGHKICSYFKKIGANRCMTQDDFERYVKDIPYLTDGQK